MPKPKRAKIEPVKRAAIDAAPASAFVMNGTAANPADIKKRGMFVATMRVLGKPVKAVCDPIARVCYPPLEAHWQERYRSRWPVKYARRMLILDFTLVTIAATLFVAGWIYNLLPVSPVAGSPFVDAIAPRELVSGEKTEFMVAFRNDSQVMMGCAKLRVHLPPGTALDEPLAPPAVTEVAAVAAPNEKFCLVGTPDLHGTVSETPAGLEVTYELGNLEPNDRDVARIPVRVYGPTGTSKILLSELLYWEEGDLEQRRVSDRSEWRVSGSPVRISADAPQRLVRGRQTSVRFTVENASSGAVGPLTLRLTRPADFVLTGTAPAVSARDAWEIESLAAGEKIDIAVVGYFSSSSAASAAAGTELSLGAYESRNGAEFLMEEVRPNLDPKASGFSLGHEVTDGARGALVPGDSVEVRVRYANAGTETLRNATISLYTDGRLVSEPSPAELTWDKTSVPALAEIAPGDNGELTAHFTLRDADAGTSAGAAANEPGKISINAFASFALADEPDNTVKVSSATTTFPIATHLGLTAAAYYFAPTGDQLGIGPLPPRVGETTKYRVLLNVSNSTGAADGVTVEAVLPPGAEWTGRYSVAGGQALDYLPLSRTVRWDIGHLPAVAGAEDEGIGASFEVALTPDSGAAGAPAELLREIAAAGNDTATGLRLHATSAPITTELPFDARAAGKGVVE